MIYSDFEKVVDKIDTIATVFGKIAQTRKRYYFLGKYGRSPSPPAVCVHSGGHKIITNSTNIYIDKIRSKFQRERDARPTDSFESKALFGVLYFLGLCRSERQNIKDLWRTDGTGIDALYCTMSYNRLLLRCLRFDDINTREERCKIDKLADIRKIFEIFVENCKKSIIPGPDLTVDEKLVYFRVDPSTMYTLNMEIYAGTQPEGSFRISNSPSEVVKRLVGVTKE
ncbi:hypothetical protein NQ318_008006 [Aromia moschata]|uniref:PiggyBac transposable element-derived protein domain-containing protein n=1 Tax=Aromia moschata TaxID=1265417 RepID=A0AAV8XVI2_9CUCU|nr:hypothetical protein NQ318_008006 [Aromia moschata]